MPARGCATKYQGSKWLRREKRLAIYLRDGLACAYCGHTVEDGAGLTLDHVVPFSQGGTHHPSNLVTACQRCNSSRGNRPMSDFCTSVAAYLNRGLTAAQIQAHVEDCLSRPLDIPAAKALIARRGGWATLWKAGGAP